MGNKRTRRSKRFETPSPHREAEVTQPETLNSGNGTLINFDNVVQESLGANPSGSQLTEPSTSNNEIQAWSQIIEQKTNDRIEKMREEMENKLDTILKEIRSSKSISTVTNPRSENIENLDPQPSGSKSHRPTGVRASGNDSFDSENEDNHSVRASDMHELKEPAKPFCQNRFELDETLVSNEDSDEEDYHTREETHKQDTNLRKTTVTTENRDDKREPNFKVLGDIPSPNDPESTLKIQKSTKN